MQWWEGLLVVVGVVLISAALLKLFKVSLKIVWTLLINALVGGVVLFLLNLIPGVAMPINWLTTILTGFFGVPAVLIIFLFGLL